MFLQEFAANNDQVKCRCIGFEDFGAPIDTATNDVPLQDMYNTGLVAPMDGICLLYTSDSSDDNKGLDY